jgi:hypothetical protein
VLGDTHYDAENVREKCEQTERFLVTGLDPGRRTNQSFGYECR